MALLLDDFNLPAQGPPPGDNWMNGWYADEDFWGPNYLLRRADGKAEPLTIEGGGAFWKNIFYADMEAFFTIADFERYENGAYPGDNFLLYFRVQDPEVYDNFYHLYFWGAPGADHTDIQIGKQVDGTFTTILEEQPTFDLHVGDSFRIKTQGSLIQVHRKTVNGDCELLYEVEDSDIAGPGYVAIETYRTYIQPVGSGKFDDFSGGPTFAPPTGLTAVIAGNVVDLAWTNTPPAYIALRVERSAASTGPWTELELGLQPDAETAVDGDPGTFDLWYRVVATNAAGEAATLPTQPAETVRDQWNTVAHAMGIEDLLPPPPPFRYGEAGELLFLVCCRLWRMEVTAGLPDPVGTDPVDWREFIETGTYPTP